MFWYGHGMSGWGYGLMSVSMVLFWAAVIVGVVAAVRYLGARGQQPGPSAAAPPTAQTLLAQRYARGEIDDDEYQRRLRVLGGAGGQAVTS